MPATVERGAISRRAFLVKTGWLAAGVTVLTSCAPVREVLTSLPTRDDPQREDGLAWAEELAHPLTQATSLAHAAILGWMRRDIAATRTHAEAAMEVSDRAGIPFRYVEGLMLQGWADAEQGKPEGFPGRVSHRRKCRRSPVSNREYTER